jgi:cytochrome c oxidase subunit 2
MLGLNFSNLPAASTAAVRFDTFWHFLLVTGTATFVLVVGAALLFVLKWKRKREGEPTPYLPHNLFVEISSLFLTSLVVAVVFIWGWQDYKYIISPKQDELEINIIGQQWQWTMQYADGRSFTNQLFLPVDRPVKLIMTAKDVLHSFFIPAFRLKQDTVPGQFTVLHMTPNKVGEFDIFCAEFCGTSHSGMLGKVTVLSAEDFQKWQNGTWKKEIQAPGVAGEAKLSMADEGALIYRRNACVTCHTVNGARLVGPSFKGLWGSDQPLMDGSVVKVDENYFRESLMDPMKKVVKGYPPAMPTYRGQLNDEEVNQLIAYLKTLQ